jgi:hypothetical protein
MALNSCRAFSAVRFAGLLPGALPQAVPFAHLWCGPRALGSIDSSSMSLPLQRLRYANAFGFILAVAALSPMAVRAQYLHPKVIAKQTTIRKIVILPAKVNVVRDSMKGPEGMAEESEALSARVEKMLAEVLAAQKSVMTLSESATTQADSQQKYTIADIQAKFDGLLPKVMKKRKDVKQGRFSMGDEVLNLNLDKSADAIVFIRGEGKKLTGGKTAFTMLVGGMPAYLKLMIGIVDARTGELLLYTDCILGGDPTTAVNRLREALEKGFKKLPAVS